MANFVLQVPIPLRSFHVSASSNSNGASVILFLSIDYLFISYLFLIFFNFKI